jgi:peptidoglycan/LPS O-acetylase OafA/YrhL
VTAPPTATRGTPYVAPVSAVQGDAAHAGERHLRFRPDIEGLRAVAIALVVLYHAGWKGARAGFLGVDVFFVLSGFLISGLLLDELAATGTVSLTKFWARRARRLLPAAALVTVVVLVASAIWLSPFDQRTDADTARAFAVYGSNILFAIRSTDYFGGAAVRDPLLHTWSLSVEEQFYLFFAPAMLVVALWLKARGPEVARRRFTVAAVAVTVLSLLGCVALVRRYPVIAFYALPARAWEFGLGALAVVAARRAGKLPNAVLELLALVGIVAIVASSAIFHDAGPILGARTLVPTLGTVAVILAGAGEQPTLVGRALSLSPARLVGRLSYSWYLWHWPALVYLRERIAEPSLRLSVAVALLSLVPAAIAYRLVESPIRFSTTLARRPRQTVVGALVLAVFIVVASLSAERYATWTLGQPRYAAILAARARARVYAENCHLSLLAVESPECRYGPAHSDTTVVLLGDSHAAQWFPALDSVAHMRGWSLVSLTKSSCPPSAVTIANTILKRPYVECDRWRESVIRRIHDMHPAIVVLAGSSNTYPLSIGNAIQYTDSTPVARRAWHDGTVRTLDALRSSGARLVLLEDTPQMRWDVPRCLVQMIDRPQRCDVPRRRALQPGAAASDRHAAAMVPGTSFVSLTDRICDGTTCPAMRDGVVHFADDNHLAVKFAESLAPALSAELTRALAAPAADSTP